jgi:hypothetical protein
VAVASLPRPGSSFDEKMLQFDRSPTLRQLDGKRYAVTRGLEPTFGAHSGIAVFGPDVRIATIRIEPRGAATLALAVGTSPTHS